MGIMDSLKGLFGGKSAAVTDKVHDAIDTAADKADDVTGGKATGQIDSAADKAKDIAGDAVDGAAE